MAQERRTAATHALEAAQAALSTAELNLKRQNTLLAEGLVSRRAMEVAQLEFTRARTELDRTQAAARASQNEVDSLEADAQRVQREAAAAANGARANAASARGEVASTRAEQSRLGVRISRQESQRVLASHDGQVLRVMTSQGGEMVKAGDPLILLVPETEDRAVEIFVDGLHAPLLREGQEVRLQFEGWPAIQFSGWPQLATGTFGGRVAFVDTADDGKGRFRALVTPSPDAPSWPAPEQLRQGVRAHAFVLLNQVTVGFELWRQVNGFPPLPTPPAKPAEKK
jgi:biotin carboxyl carrier protein